MDSVSGEKIVSANYEHSTHMNNRFTPDGRYYIESDINGRGTGIGVKIWDESFGSEAASSLVISLGSNLWANCVILSEASYAVAPCLAQSMIPAMPNQTAVRLIVREVLARTPHLQPGLNAESTPPARRVSQPPSPASWRPFGFSLLAKTNHTDHAQQSNTTRGRAVQEPKSQAPQVPPDVARYLSGARPESQQFDFLIGDWIVTATRYKEDGSPLFQYKATWNAKYLNEGRMVIDDFKAYAPTGQAVSSYVTLRTYSETNHRWEMAGLAALQPAVNAEWIGHWKDGEMLMSAIGKDPAGNVVRTKIRFFQIAKDSFEWESQVSRDDGRSWSKTASLLASRAPE